MAGKIKKPKLLRHILTDLGIGILVLAAIPLGTVYGGWHWVRGETGRAWLTAELNALAAREGIDARLGRIDRLDTGRIDITTLNWRGESGHSAAAESLTIAFKPLALLRGRIEMERLDLDGLALLLADTPPRDPNDPVLLPAFEIPSLTLPNLYIGALSITGTIERSGATHPVAVTGRVDLHPITPFNSIVHLNLHSGDHDVLALRLPEGAIRLDDASGLLSGRAVQAEISDGLLTFDAAGLARGRGNITLRTGRTPHLHVAGEVQPLAFAAPAIQTALTLTPDRADIALNADLWQVDDDTAITAPHLRLSAQRERGGTLALTLAAGVEGTPFGTLTDSLRADAAAQWDGRALRLQNLRVENDGLTLNTHGTFIPATMTAALTIDAALNDPALTVKGPLSWSPEGGLHGDLSAQLMTDYKIDSAFSLKDSTLALHAIALDAGGVRGEGNAAIALDTRTASIDLTFDLNGTPVPLSAAIGMAEDSIITLPRLRAGYGDHVLTLDRAAHIRVEADGTVRTGDLALRLDDLPLSLAVQAGAELFDATLTLPALDMAQAGTRMDLPFDRGRLSGALRLHGGYDAARATLSLTLDDAALGGVQPIGAEITGTHNGAALTLNATLRGPEAMTLNGTATLPFTLTPLTLSGDTPVQGRLSGGTTLDALARLALIDGHVLSGPVELDVRLDGTLSAPQPHGGATVRGGAYESLLYGTRLRDIHADLRFDGQTLSLHDVQAGDGNGGRITGGGTITLPPGAAPQIDLTLNAERFQALSLPTLSAVAGAGLRLSGTVDDALLSGTATLNRADLYLTRLQGGGDPYRAYTLIEDGATGTPTQSAPPSRLRLDLKVSANNGVFVRGPGLDSEWAADLSIQGTADTPRIAGTLSTLRGRYDAFDLVMTLLPGTVQLDGGDIADAALNLAATIRGRGNAQARLNATGTVRSPRIALTSESGAQDDDVLAELLFGRSMGDLSPMQALRVAQVLAALAGQDVGAGFDPVGALRRGVGLDMLSVDFDDEGDSRLSAGKYIADDVYVTIEQGTAPGSTRVRTEIDLTDRIKGEAAIGADADNSIGIKWQKDY